jgi:hypothetical protein
LAAAKTTAGDEGWSIEATYLTVVPVLGRLDRRDLAERGVTPPLHDLSAGLGLDLHRAKPVLHGGLRGSAAQVDGNAWEFGRAMVSFPPVTGIVEWLG